nr:transporter substrate-binding domain-containing protein [Marinobacter daepoensis]
MNSVRQRHFVFILIVAMTFMAERALSDTASESRLLLLAPDIPGMSEPGGHGRDVETVVATLGECGWEADFVYQPFGRHLRTYQDLPSAAGVLTVPLSSVVDGYSTAAYVWYQNGAFYNASRVAPIETVEDLKGLKLVTFQDGIEILRLTERKDEFELLLEISNQTIHTRMLLMGRVDVILSDGGVVAAVAERIRGERRNGEAWPLENDEFVFSPIFTPTPYKMVFRDPGMAKAFDACFDRIRARGGIAGINAKFIDRYQSVLKFRYLGY